MIVTEVCSVEMILSLLLKNKSQPWEALWREHSG